MDELEQSKEIEAVSEEPAEIPKEPKPEPSKFNLFMRRLLRWTTGIFAIFALGIILTWFVQVSPRIKEVIELEDQLELANLKASDLEFEVSELQDIGEANIALGTSLEEARLHLSILSIFVDVNNAQLALTNNSPDTALSDLAETRAKLTALLTRLDNEYGDTVSAMQERLGLALDEITGDVFAAQSDLEVLRNSILALERSLFGE